MATTGGFAATLKQLTAQLQSEHQRELDGLQAKIDRLALKLSAYERVQSEPLRDWTSSDTPLGPSHPGTPSSGEAERDRRKSFRGARAAMNFMQLPRSSSSLHFVSSRNRVPTSSCAAVGLVEKLVYSNAFDCVFAVLVGLNAICMAVEAQYLGFEIAAELEDRAPGHGDAVEIFRVATLFFTSMFAFEVVLRIIGLRLNFFRSAWNLIDLTVVLLEVFRQLVGGISVNLQILRLVRFVKLLRLARLIKQIQGFDSLFLMTNALRGSVSILAWTSCLLLLLMGLNSLLLHGFLSEYYFTNQKFPLSERQALFKYFGTFTSSFFSMFELTLANWPPISRALYENVSEWFIVVAIFHKLTFGFAVIGVMNGVFIQETFQAAQHDDEIILRRASRAARIHADKMTRLVKTVDTSGEGVLDIVAFRKIFENSTLRRWLASMEFMTEDVDCLFDMMDDGDGRLSVQEVIKGVLSLKGGARNIDLQILLREHRQLLQEQRRLQASVEEHMAERYSDGSPTAI